MPDKPNSNELSGAAPDDSGADAFERFCYQAHVALPFCIECATGGKIRVVYLEHFEDVVVETEDRWRFLQIKTRDPELGPWKLMDMVGKSGAFRSLLRTHEALTDSGRTYSLEAHLEGAIKRGDKLEDFPNGDCETVLCDKLQIDSRKCVQFMDRLIVRGKLPHRDVIDDTILAHLGRIAQRSTQRQRERIRDDLCLAIYSAMAAAKTGMKFPDWIIEPPAKDDEIRARIEAKTLNREKLSPLMAGVSVGSRQLIQRLVEMDRPVPSALEVKLLAGGATPTIVEDAKSLRANASLRATELMASGGVEDELADVRERLRIRANGEVARYQTGQSPAVDAWSSLIRILPNHAAVIDGSSLFGQDPDLLLGELCDLTDRCVTDWGNAP